MVKDRKRNAENGGNNVSTSSGTHMLRHRDSIAGRFSDERVVHDEEFGEENVEMVDSDWADFERALRYSPIYCFSIFPPVPLNE